MEKLMAQMEAGPKPAAGSAPGGSVAGPPAAGGKPGGGAGSNPFARPPVFLTLKATEGVHDVYFVFKNSAAKAIQPLMSLSTIRFMDVLNQ